MDHGRGHVPYPQLPAAARFPPLFLLPVPLLPVLLNLPASKALSTWALISPLSGSSAVSGQIMQNATKMAVDEINAAGGINGTIPINLVSVDDEGVPATSVTAMQKLVEQDKVNAVIGAQASSCTLANMEITKAAKIPQITPASSNVAVTQSGNDYIYQLTATDELHMRNVMGYMVDENNAKTFAILYGVLRLRHRWFQDCQHRLR